MPFAAHRHHLRLEQRCPIDIGIQWIERDWENQEIRFPVHKILAHLRSSS